MITRAQHEWARTRAANMIVAAGIPAGAAELNHIEVADMGLGELEQSGVQILTLVNTDKIAVKVLVSFPGQTEPEHWHPRLGEYAGKEETIRCHWGELYLYTPGLPAPCPRARPPEHRRRTYTVWHEYVLTPGLQVTLEPGTAHWFQGGPTGAVFWSFSTKAVDIADLFSDPDVRRETVIAGDGG